MVNPEPCNEMKRRPQPFVAITRGLSVTQMLSEGEQNPPAKVGISVDDFM